MIPTVYRRRNLVLTLALGVLVAVAGVYKGRNFQSKSQAIQSSSVRATDNKQELTENRVHGILVSEFDGWFDLDDRLISPSYISADFNGDGIEDLAASVRINREISSDDTTQASAFRFEKPLGPGPDSPPVRPARMTIGALRWYHDHNATVLAIIHGSREFGLGNTKPDQRFVLVDGWDNGKLKLRAYRGRLNIARYGDEHELVQAPLLVGTALLLINIENTATAVYWDGNAYRWYPVPHPPN